MSEVMSFDTTRTKNWMAMVDCAQLGWFDGPGPVVDCTFNTGKFWQEGAAGLVPSLEHRHDLDPQWNVNVSDYRDLPYADGQVGCLVLDPRYKLSGTSTGEGPSKLDADYGVTTGEFSDFQTVNQIHEMIYEGMHEAARVVGKDGFLLLKVQAQINASTLHDQPGMFAAHAKTSGFWKIRGFLHVMSGARKQPGVQRTPRNNYSTLVGLQRTGKRFA